MRNELKKLDGQRLWFAAKIDRFGIKRAFRGAPLETILLTDVRLLDSGNVVTDHLWLTKGKAWDHFEIGDTVYFNARVGQYIKGYQGYREDVLDASIEIDFRLERPTRINKYDA